MDHKEEVQPKFQPENAFNTIVTKEEIEKFGEVKGFFVLAKFETGTKARMEMAPIDLISSLIGVMEDNHELVRMFEYALAVHKVEPDQIGRTLKMLFSKENPEVDGFLKFRE